MQEKDLKIGGYYVGEWKYVGRNMDLILKYGGDLDKEVNQFISAEFTGPRNYNKGGSCCTSSGNGVKFREATQEEIEWLNACILAKKFVSKPKIINDFPIY